MLAIDLHISDVVFEDGGDVDLKLVVVSGGRPTFKYSRTKAADDCEQCWWERFVFDTCERRPSIEWHDRTCVNKPSVVEKRTTGHPSQAEKSRDIFAHLFLGRPQ